MRYNKLGSSDLDVSEVCLGSMTWGHQNSQADADLQIALALESGVNFIDTAEMYPIPPNPERYGKTEEVIGDWLARNAAKRPEFILASKVVGPGLPWIRNGAPLKGEDIETSVNQSLSRLNTDYIDLYQIHWPNRRNPHFGNHWPNDIQPSSANPASERETMHQILDALSKCIQAGKIRHIGLSDDTSWGIQTYLNLSKEFNLPKVVSIQNEFNLFHTKDWSDVIETCVMENVAYLPWSPLAGGVLSGKYLNGAIPEGSRWSFSQRNGIFRDTEAVHAATAEYKALAEKMSISLPTLALAWCRKVDGVTSSIIGATSIEQLKEDIAAFELDLTDDQFADITAILKKYPAPF